MLTTWQEEFWSKEQLQVTELSIPLMVIGILQFPSPLHGSWLKSQSFLPNIFPISLKALTAFKFQFIQLPRKSRTQISLYSAEEITIDKLPSSWWSLGEAATEPEIVQKINSRKQIMHKNFNFLTKTAVSGCLFILLILLCLIPYLNLHLIYRVLVLMAMKVN